MRRAVGRSPAWRPRWSHADDRAVRHDNPDNRARDIAGRAQCAGNRHDALFMGAFDPRVAMGWNSERFDGRNPGAANGYAFAAVAKPGRLQGCPKPTWLHRIGSVPSKALWPHDDGKSPGRHDEPIRGDRSTMSAMGGSRREAHRWHTTAEVRTEDASARGARWQPAFRDGGGDGRHLDQGRIGDRWAPGRAADVAIRPAASSLWSTQRYPNIQLLKQRNALRAQPEKATDQKGERFWILPSLSLWSS